MLKQRIPETDQGITGELEVADYNDFQKTMRDRGILDTKDIIKSGILSGTSLEIGPGSGYLGLEWLKKTKNTYLNWLEISQDMKNIALKNAVVYGLVDRIKITLADATKGFPFEDKKFDAVFTNGSLHEWVNPGEVFNDIFRVLKEGGKFYISDLKRNINPFLFFLMKKMTNKESMKQGLITSVHAAYIKREIIDILDKSAIESFIVKENPFGLVIKKGTKV